MSNVQGWDLRGARRGREKGSGPWGQDDGEGKRGELNVQCPRMGFARRAAGGGRKAQDDGVRTMGREREEN
jgi:hypothetical protein